MIYKSQMVINKFLYLKQVINFGKNNYNLIKEVLYDKRKNEKFKNIENLKQI